MHYTMMSCIVNAPAGGSRPGASVTIGGLVVEPYTTVTSSALSSGIQCTGGDDAMWILPDGMTLTTTPSMNLMVQALSSGSELLKVNNALPVGITGVFWCSVEYDTYTDIIPILIENTPSQSYHSHSFIFVNIFCRSTINNCTELSILRLQSDGRFVWNICNC